MKYFSFLFAFCILTFSAFAQFVKPKYNKALADSLGADEYGMKMYVFVILKSGPSAITDKKITDSLFGGHMANIARMVDAGKLYVAGPMGDNNKNYRGIFILNVKTFQEAEALLKNDPAISSGLLAVEMYNWYGSAALGQYLPDHKKIQRSNF